MQKRRIYPASLMAFCLLILSVSSAMACDPATEEIDFKKHNPMQVLKLMSKARTDWIQMPDAPRNWIREEHIPKLIELLDSKEPCAGLYSSRDSRAFRQPKKKGKSTIGHEAAHMIESFFHGVYPKTFQFSIDWPRPDNDALRAQWKKHQEK